MFEASVGVGALLCGVAQLHTRDRACLVLPHSPSLVLPASQGYGDASNVTIDTVAAWAQNGTGV